MKILHVLDHSIPVHSGYSFRTRAILENQRARGWETEHVTSAKHPEGPSEEDVDGLRFHRTAPDKGLLAARVPGFDQYAVIATLERRLVELIPRLQPDVLHAHSPCLTGLAALRAARRFGLPVVYEIRAIWEDGSVLMGVCTEWGPRYRVSRMMETSVLKRASAVTTICDGLRREILSRGIPEEKVTVVPNAVDLSRFEADPPRDAALAGRLGLTGKKVLGFLGSFFRYEGLPLLVEALAVMHRARPDVALLLVGGGEDEGAIAEAVAAHGLEDAVVCPGRVPHDEVASYYGLVDVLVYPRLRCRTTEMVTPLKPLEAMAQRKPVIASDVAGHRELIEPGVTGLFFRADDAESLASTALALLDDEAQAARLVEAGRRYVAAERSWSSVVARYEDVYAAALKHPQPLAAVG